MFFDKYFKASKKVYPFEKSTSTAVEHQSINNDLEANLHKLVNSVGNPSDMLIHRIKNKGKTYAVVVYLSSLTDGRLVRLHVVEPLNKFALNNNNNLDLNTAKLILHTYEANEFVDLHEAIDNLLAGNTLILISKNNTVLAVSYPGYPRRQVKEPPTEKVVKGSREGFVDELNDNLGLVRRWIKDPNLRIESKFLGERTKTEISVLYLKDVANPDVVKELHKRLEQVKIDGVVDSNYISEIITDKRLTIFPLIQSTERPDKVAGAILEGRVAILVDKSPFVLIVPVTSTEFYQTSEDFSLNYLVGTFIRFIRGLGTLTSVTLPAVYVATVSMNAEFLPANIVQLFSSGRTLMPFPLVVEVFISLIIFEIFREAIVRVPGNVNSILGIAGGFLLGYAAIISGIVYSATVMVVVITVLSTFSTANIDKEQAWRLVRYFLLLAGGIFGLLGVILAGVIVLAHMASLKSFGVSYLGPWGPPMLIDMIDAYIRIPWWASYRRPPTYRPQQEDRLGSTEGEDEA